MNAVEIEEAITALASQPFDGDEFPFAFLRAFGNKETTIKRLRAGTTNKSDLGGVLQTNNIHIAVSEAGQVTSQLNALRASPATSRAKARFILSTDGAQFEAEDLETGETVACEYPQFPDHFGFFLPLAGISTVKQVRDSAFDIRATSRLNRLYVELLKDMQGRTRLSVIAGMYHEWDKQLHQWMFDQMNGWCIGEKWAPAVWKATLTNLADLVEPLGWAIRSKPYFTQLDACRLVVNVYKHGNGNSLTQLKRGYPEYLHDQVGEMFGEPSVDKLNHQHLMVTDDQLSAFSEAIVSFWQDVPQNMYEQEGVVMPGWLSKALGDSSHAPGKVKGESTP